VPEKCTECVGFFNREQWPAVCSVDCCVPNPDDPASFLGRARVIHPEKEFRARFREK